MYPQHERAAHNLVARFEKDPEVLAVILAGSIAKGLDTRCITCCVLGGASVTRGGKGTIIGCFLGVFIIGLLQNSLDLLAVSSYWQEFIQGIVLFLAVSADFFRTLIARRKKK